MAGIERRALAGYATGSLGTGVYLTVPSILLLYFMTDVLGVASGLAAAAIVGPKLLGAMLDPVIGWLSDHTRSPWGRRRPWMFVGALGMGATFVVLFHVPDFASAQARFAYVLGVFLASALFYSSFATPYVAMPAEMSGDPDERTRIMAWRMAFVMGGIILGSAVAPMLVSMFGGGRKGYGGMSLVIGGACVAAMLVAVGATAPAPRASGGEALPKRPLSHDLKAVANNQRFLRLAAVFLLQTSVFGMVGALLPYAVSRLLGGDEGLVGGLFLVLLLSAMACMRPWVVLAARWGRRRCLMAASLAHGVLSLTLAGLGAGYPMPLLFAQFAAMGAAYAGLQLLPFSMLTDMIQGDRALSGQEREGAFSGAWTAAEKLGLAAGPALAAGMLAAFHYQPDAPSGIAVAMIRYMMALGPAAVQILAVVLLLGYPADEPSRRGSTGGR